MSVQDPTLRDPTVKDAVADDISVHGVTPRDELLGSIEGTKDALNVRRVFGDPYVVDGVTIIPVARVAGGGGGGAGEGMDDNQPSRGFGTGFGLGAHPVGVYEIREGDLRWRPAVDVNRVVRGGQVLAGIMSVCVTLVLIARR